MKLLKEIHIEGFIKEEEYFETLYLSKDSELRNGIEDILTNLLKDTNVKNLASSKDKYDNYVEAIYKAENIGLRAYFTGDKTTLDEASEYLLLDTMGVLSGEEKWYGYSEWTIMGTEVSKFKIGGHNIIDLLKLHKGQYVHLVLGIYEDTKNIIENNTPVYDVEISQNGLEYTGHAYIHANEVITISKDIIKADDVIIQFDEEIGEIKKIGEEN